MVLDACSNMQSLQHLDLSSNGIGGDGRRSLFTSLPSCTSLKVRSALCPACHWSVLVVAVFIARCPTTMFGASRPGILVLAGTRHAQRGEAHS